MCRLKDLYCLDLYSDSTTGFITFNVANSLPQLMNKPCKIVVKQIQMEQHDGTPDISQLIFLRIVHNINIQSGSNFNGFSNSNVLSFIDNYSVRTVDTTHQPSFTRTDLQLYAPNGFPAILNLNRRGAPNTSPVVDAIVDDPALSWCVRLEITINPDDQE